MKDWTKDYTKINNELFADLAKSKITLNEYKILMYLIYVLKKGNLIIASQAQIARDLDINKSNVSKAFKQLVEKNILIKNDSTSHTFLNSNLINLYADNNINSAKNLKLDKFEKQEYSVARNQKGKNKKEEQNQLTKEELEFDPFKNEKDQKTA